MDRRRSLLKIAALRSERERQEGVKMGYGQSITSNSVTALIGSPVPIGTGDFTLEYFGNSYGSTTVYSSFMFNAAHRDMYSRGSLFVYSISGKGVGWILFEKPSSGDPLLDSIDLITGETGTPFHFVLTRNGTTVKAYFNGELKATKEQSAVKDLGDFRLGMANSSEMVMSRIYNYALSAEEVVALYNDGDPSGYVLPGTMKDLTPVEIVGNNSHTWTGVDDPVSFDIKINRVLSVGGAFRITGSVSNYKSGTPSLNLGHNSIAYLPKDNSPFTLVVTLKEGSSTLLPYIYIYGGSSSEDKQLTITVDSIEPVGCIAEYLPQNLVGQWREKPFDLSGQNSYTWTGETDTIYSRSVLLGRTCKSGTAVSVKGTVSDYQSGAPFIYAGLGRVDIPAKDGDFTVMVTGLDAFDRVSYYGGLNGSDRRLTITIDSVDLIPDVALAWLDSARQLPLNDEYLPPLLQSDGGYDLTASGAPQIIIK